VEEELDLDRYDNEEENQSDFYFSGGTKVEQEGAVGANSDDEDLFGTAKSTRGKQDEREEGDAKAEVSISRMKWDKGKVVEKDLMQVRQGEFVRSRGGREGRETRR